jgi:hypothetical protein
MSRFRNTTVEAENEKLDFVQEAISKFDKNAGLASVGDLAPGSYFAIRHGLGNDCLLVFRLDPEHEPEIFADCLDRDVSRTASGAPYKVER